MKEDIEILYEMWFDGWHGSNLFGKTMMIISVPIYLIFVVSVLLIERIGPRIFNAFEWFHGLMKR